MRSITSITKLRTKSKIDRNRRSEPGSPSRCGARGFTLVELLIVLAILSLLTAVVTLSVIGAFERGREQAYAIDRNAIQSTILFFYYDGHACDTSPGNAWDSAASPIFSHYYPTGTGAPSGRTIGEIVADANFFGSGYTFSTEAIWMGLLYNSPSATSTHDKDGASPLLGEKGPYLIKVPESANSNNYSTATGSYTWVITKAGVVYGVYWDGSAWRQGFSGRYP